MASSNIPVICFLRSHDKITTEESIAADQEALYLLAHRADGALRDAESLLDQVVSFSDEVTTVQLEARRRFEESAETSTVSIDRNVVQNTPGTVTVSGVTPKRARASWNGPRSGPDPRCPDYSLRPELGGRQKTPFHPVSGSVSQES